MKRHFPGLYAILDVDALERRGLAVVQAGRALLLGGPKVLQLRAKHAGAAQTLAWLRSLRGPTRDAGVLLFANDRADLAEAAGCDGVHVGQNDLPLEDVRRAFPRLRVGVSTHDVSQLTHTLSARPDYAALGPVFGTENKRNPEPTVGFDELERLSAAAHRASVPLVAIGGIDEASAVRVAALGVAVAVIGALLPDIGVSGQAAYDEITRRTARLSSLFRPPAT